MKQLIRQNALLTYTVLTFAFSWGLIVILAGFGNIPIDPQESEALLPILYSSMLVGPSVAGLLLIGIIEGKKGFKDLLSRLLKWRIPFPWYLFALLATPVLAIVILEFLALFDPVFQIGLWQSDNFAELLLNGLIAGIMVGLFEEIGWTGFLIPRFLKKYSILFTGIMIGLIWGAWHFILFWEQESFLGLTPFIILIARLFAWLPPFRILMVWLYDRTGSLLIVILMHLSLVVTTTVIVPMNLTGTALITWLLAWSALLWIAAVLLYTYSRKEHHD